MKIKGENEGIVKYRVNLLLDAYVKTVCEKYVKFNDGTYGLSEMLSIKELARTTLDDIENTVDINDCELEDSWRDQSHLGKVTNFTK